MKRYLFNLLLCLTQTLNAILGGDPDESLSSRCAKKHPWAAAVIDRLFWFDPRHCSTSLEKDEGDRSLTADDREQMLLAWVLILALYILLR